MCFIRPTENYAFIDILFSTILINGSDFLFFSDSQLADQGMYTCAAQNQFGLIEASAFLTITGIGKEEKIL